MFDFREYITGFHDTSASYVLRDLKFHWANFVSMKNNHITAAGNDFYSIQSLGSMWEAAAKASKVHNWKPLNNAVNNIKRVGVQSKHGVEVFGLKMIHGSETENQTSFHLDCALALQDQSLEAFRIKTSKCAIKLQGLSLVLYGDTQADKAKLKALMCKIYRNFHSLKSFEISFTGFYIVGLKDFKSLLSPTTYFLKLQNLALYFSVYNRITDDHLRTISSTILKRPNCLTSLTLSFDKCLYIGDGGLEDLMRGIIRHNNTLKSLELSFPDCNQMTQKSLEIVTSAISQHMYCLEDLYLDFSKCINLKMEDLRLFGTPTYVAQLQRLSLSFYGCTMIDNDGVKSLLENIGEWLGDLKVLKLDFSCCQSITDQSLAIMENIVTTYLTQLEHLSLEFSFCREMSKEAKEDLKSNLWMVSKVYIL